MPKETLALVEFAASLRSDDIPTSTLEAARNTIADGVSACIYGYRMPWSATVRDYATGKSIPGHSCVLGPGGA
jgi:2-methylcitrate dehydratase PrpD